VRKTAISVGLAILTWSAGSASCDQSKSPDLVITAEAVSAASIRIYSGILSRACVNGHTYSRSQIERGFKRHANEMMLQLAGLGYTIVPYAATDRSRHSPRIATKLVPDPSNRSFGCFRRYWLYE
jgi:hypothetical protein